MDILQHQELRSQGSPSTRDPFLTPPFVGSPGYLELVKDWGENTGKTLYILGGDRALWAPKRVRKQDARSPESSPRSLLPEYPRNYQYIMDNNQHTELSMEADPSPKFSLSAGLSGSQGPSHGSRIQYLLFRARIALLNTAQAEESPQSLIVSSPHRVGSQKTALPSTILPILQSGKNFQQGNGAQTEQDPQPPAVRQPIKANTSCMDNCATIMIESYQLVIQKMGAWVTAITDTLQECYRPLPGSEFTPSTDPPFINDQSS